MKGWSAQHNGGRCSFTWLLSSGTRARVLPHGFPLIFSFASANLLCVRAASEPNLSLLLHRLLQCFETVTHNNNELPQSVSGFYSCCEPLEKKNPKCFLNGGLHKHRKYWCIALRLSKSLLFDSSTWRIKKKPSHVMLIIDVINKAHC